MDKVDDTSTQLAVGTATTDFGESKSIFILLLDLHCEGWLSRSKVPLNDVLPSLLVLLNAHLALDSGNEVAVIGYNGAGTKMLYSTLDFDVTAKNCISQHTELKGTMLPQFKNVGEAVLAAARQHVALGDKEHNASLSTSVAGPLSLALAYLNRKLDKSRGYILVVSAESNNVGSKYIPAMNSIFSAQKLRVPIDVASFGHAKSFLQQAADFTGGAYVEIDSAGGMVETFLSVFLVDPSVREYVNLATKPDVNFSAVCFISKKVIQIGYVCSVCLCIMEAVPRDNKCPVCHTTYDVNPSTISV